MIRPARLAAALAFAAALPALPAAATDLGQMTDAEREAFRQEVRAYLLENPEVLMEAIQVLQDREAKAQAQGDSQLLADNAKAIFEDGHSFVGGNPAGDVTIVEFMDYRCGYCRKSHPELASLLETDGNIRWIVKEFPILGDQSLLASRFAISVLNSAGPDAYLSAHNSLMEMRAEITEESLRRLAGDLGLDVDATMAGMSAPEVDQVIAANHALAETLRINGTPGFVFESELVRGYIPLSDMQALVAHVRG